MKNLFFPLAYLYTLILHIRHFLYDKSIFPSTSFQKPIISVGNLSFGGSGKTPMVEYLTNFFKTNYSVAILSRGYKRKTKGFIEYENSKTINDIGDEPYQFAIKFPKIRVAVSKDRCLGVRKLAKSNLIILDDAFQHRKLNPGLSILLTEFDNPFYNDNLFPVGRLRDLPIRYKKADIILITKCPESINKTQKKTIINDLKITPRQHVFFSKITYSNTILGSTSKNIKLLSNTKFTLVTGFVKHHHLTTYLRSLNLHFEHLRYPDHYDYKTSDFTLLNTKKYILTSEKDYFKLKNKVQVKLWYIPIKIEFIENQEQFHKLLANYVNAYSN